MHICCDFATDGAIHNLGLMCIIYVLYLYVYVVTVIRASHVARMEEGRSSFEILTGREHYIRMDLNKIGINYWRALVNAALNFRVP